MADDVFGIGMYILFVLNVIGAILLAVHYDNVRKHPLTNSVIDCTVDVDNFDKTKQEIEQRCGKIN